MKRELIGRFYYLLALWIAGSVALALGLFVLLFFNGQKGVINVVYAKGQKLENETFVQWSVGPARCGSFITSRAVGKPI